jgi:hypothetical protein
VQIYISHDIEEISGEKWRLWFVLLHGNSIEALLYHPFIKCFSTMLHSMQVPYGFLVQEIVHAQKIIFERSGFK